MDNILRVNPEFTEYIDQLGVDQGACHIIALAVTANEKNEVTDVLDWVMSSNPEYLAEQLQLALKAICSLEDANDYILKIPYLVDESEIVSHYNRFKEEFISRGWNIAGSPNAIGGSHKFSFDTVTEKTVNNTFKRVCDLYGEIDYDIVFGVLSDYYHTSENQQLLRFTNFLVNNFEVEYATRIKS
jgi:hypothetical protein